MAGPPGDPASLLIGIGAGVAGVGSTTGGVPFLVAGATILMLAIALASAVRQVFAVAVYRYALDGEARGGFAEADLAHPVRPRRRGLLRRG